MTSKLSFLILGIAVVAKAQHGYQRENPADQLSYDSGRYNEEEVSSGDEIPGEAGKDYPTYGEIPETRFDCGQQQFPGYYADPEARCQIYHVCQIGGQKDSFLCPNGTLFNQEKVVCDWWFNVDCAQAQSFYSINEAIVRAMEDADRLTAERKAAEGYRYGTPNGSRNQHQRPSSAGGPRPDFDTVVIEAARIAPHGQLSQPAQFQRESYAEPEVARHQPAGYFSENNGKSSEFNYANFGQQIRAGDRDAEAVQEIEREYLPAKLRDNKY